MKLQHLTTFWFVAALVLLISIWAAIFYFALLNEIYDSIDDGLDNQKQLIIQRASFDSTVLLHDDFAESGYAIKQLPAAAGINFTDRYADTTMYMQNEDDHEPVRLLTTAFRQGNRYYQLQIATSMVEEDDLVAELLYSLLWLFFGLVCSIILLNKLLLGRIWQPFYYLLGQLKHYKLDAQPGIRVKQTRIEEFRLLNENITNLLNRNRETFNSQKQFIENASHELQTPLAISITKLETLAERGHLSEAEMELLGTALDHLERMARLNRSLLLLSRIENKQFADTTAININDLVKKLAEDFSDQLQFSNISIAVTESEECTLHMNPDLAVVMLTNLIKNAIVHNHPGGSVHISIGANRVVVENTADDTALDTTNLFSRFYKKKPSSSSTGLGLAIIKAITDMHGYTLAYTFTGKHVFTLVLQ
jgi:signal transduction histidine kinase